MIVIRHARERDAADVARIYVDMWRVAYAQLLEPDFLRELSYRRSLLQWRSVIGRHSGILLVAESSDDGVVGFAAGGAARTRSYGVDGELTALYVLARHHRRGIGRALIRRMARELIDNGRSGMVVWVLADNPARRFYERLGGKPAGEQRLRVGGSPVVERAYVWQNLDELVSDG